MTKTWEAQGTPAPPDTAQPATVPLSQAISQAAAAPARVETPGRVRLKMSRDGGDASLFYGTASGQADEGKNFGKGRVVMNGSYEVFSFEVNAPSFEIEIPRTRNPFPRAVFALHVADEARQYVDTCQL